jgi:hypothetical protein
VVLTAECCRLEEGDADMPDLQSPPPMNRGSGYMPGSETAAGVSTVSLARPSRPLVAMITVAAGSTIAALKIKNLAVFEAGTTSQESWLIAPSKLAWKITTGSTLLAVTL